MEQAANRQRILVIMIVFGVIGLWVFAHTGERIHTPRYNVPEVSLEQAKTMVDSGAMVIDVRGTKQFAFQHISGALLLPLDMLRVGIPLSFDVTKDTSIIVYCNDGQKSGPEATHILRQAGYSRAVNLKSGFDGWQSAGLPTVKG